MIRDDILNTAKDLIGGPRKQDYGDLRTNFDTCANLWAVWLHARFDVQIDLTAEDVAVMNMMIKQARLGNNIAYADGWIDIAGYSALGGELATEENI